MEFFGKERHFKSDKIITRINNALALRKRERNKGKSISQT